MENCNERCKANGDRRRHRAGRVERAECVDCSTVVGAAGGDPDDDGRAQSVVAASAHRTQQPVYAADCTVGVRALV